MNDHTDVKYTEYHEKKKNEILTIYIATTLGVQFVVISLRSISRPIFNHTDSVAYAYSLHTKNFCLSAIICTALHPQSPPTMRWPTSRLSLTNDGTSALSIAISCVQHKCSEQAHRDVHKPSTSSRRLCLAHTGTKCADTQTNTKGLAEMDAYCMDGMYILMLHVQQQSFEISK